MSLSLRPVVLCRAGAGRLKREKVCYLYTGDEKPGDGMALAGVVNTHPDLLVL